MTKLNSLALAAAFFSSSAFAQLPFETAIAMRQALPIERSLDGTIEAIHRSTLSAQTSGRVVEILFEAEDTVTAGQVVLRLRDIAQQADLTAAEAAQKGAQSGVNQALKERDRVRSIYQKKLVSKAAMDTAQTALNNAIAARDSAAAAVEQAKEQLERTVVRAPYTGVVLERHIELGESAAPGKPLMTGASLDHLRVSTVVPQMWVAAAKQSASLSVFSNDNTRVQTEAPVFFSSSKAGSSGIVTRANLPEGTAGFYPGMYVKIELSTGERSSITVPNSALLQRAELRAVYVIDEERVQLRQVRPGAIGAQTTEILSGLAADEQVALDPIAAASYLKAQRTKPETKQ